MDTHRLSELEGQTYRAVVDDGLWDLLLGAVFLLMGVSGITHRRLIPGYLLIAFSMPVWRYLRKRITEPRVGYVQWNPARKSRMKRAGCILAISVAGLLAVLLLPKFLGPEALRQGLLQIPGRWKAAVLLAIPLAIAGYVFELKRLLIYAAVVLLSTAILLAVEARGEWVLVVSGAAAIISGLVVLAMFLRRYPGQGKEQALHG